jgi:tetratricopeptide (TPR) repeat protein
MRGVRLLLLPPLVVPILIGFPLTGQLTAESREGGKSERGVAVEQRRQEEMTHQTFEQQMELRQKKHEAPIPLNPLEEQVEEKDGAEQGAGRFLGTAWQYCNRGEHRRAIEIFATLSSDPATEWEAKYGLAMCYVKAKDAKQAIPLLEELIGKRLHLKDTLPTLLALLVEGKDYGKAATYLQLLASRERERWEETIRTGTLLAALEQVKAAGNLEGLLELIRTHSDLLDRCQSPEVFLEAAKGLSGVNDRDALETYTRLLRACPRKWDIRLGILYALRSVLPPTDMLLELEQEEHRTNLDPVYRTQLTDIRVAVFRDQLAAASPDAPEVERLARAILALKPEDKGALTALAWWAFNHGQYEQAVQGFTTLAQRDPEDLDYVSGLANTLVKLQRVDEAFALVERMRRKDERFGKLETDIRVAVFRDQLAAASPDAPEVERLARAILALKPEDKGALTALAWWAFNHGQYEQAVQGFTTLAQRDPEDLDVSYGLAHALMKLKRVDEALALIEPLKVRDARFVALETDILMERALTAFQNTRYAEAERYLKSLLTRRPDHLDTKRLLAWSIYNQKRWGDALPLFLSLFNQQEDPGIANTILDIYTTARDRRRAAAFAEDLARSGTQGLKKVAGDFYFKSGYPVLAASTYCDPDTCYYNADTPFAEASSFSRQRSGTQGQSKLTEYTVPLGVSYTLSPDTEVGLSLMTHRLSSGDAALTEILNGISSSAGIPLNLTADAFSGITHQFTTSASVVTPEIKLVREGIERSYRLAMGTTPLGGTMFPLPTFFAQTDAKEWNLNIHQSSVNDSILSYVGIHAKVPTIPQVPVRLLPSDRKWGRVVKTGIEGEWAAPGLAPYWLSVKGSYDFYHGKRVIDNHAYRSSLAAGRTLTAERWTISPGLHFTMQHFAHNANFFTPGHGGYFSPDTHYISGPFVNLQTRQCNTFLIEGQFGINYFSARSNGAPADPLRILGLPEQIRFSSSSSSGLGFAMNLKGQILLGNHWALGGTVEANKAADFTEIRAGINLHYFFEPRSKLSQRDTVFR